MNIALIKNKVVENIAVFETLQDAANIKSLLDIDEVVEANGDCSIGYTYDNGTFVPPMVQPTETELKIQLLEAQIKALTNQNEILENGLLEMATIVYA